MAFWRVLRGCGPALLAGYVAAGPVATFGEDPPPPPAAVEAEVRAFDESFARAFEGGDARALASMFTEDAEVFEADGARYRGRDLIERRFAETMAAHKGARIALEPASIRPVSDDVVKEEGRSVTTLPSGAITERLYTAILVRRDGRWLLDDIREEDEPKVRPHERLQELEWMVGEWVDAGPESETRVDCRWSADGNFLLREFTVKRGGKPVLQASQRVGWDPVLGEFRSWEFDSEGGFGEGRWSRDGDRWVVKHSGVRPEGVAASSTRTMIPTRTDQIRWVQGERTIAGEAIPGEVSSVLTRIPPPPRLGATPAAAPVPDASPSRDETRSR